MNKPLILGGAVLLGAAILMGTNKAQDNTLPSFPGDNNASGWDYGAGNTTAPATGEPNFIFQAPSMATGGDTKKAATSSGVEYPVSMSGATSPYQSYADQLNKGLGALVYYGTPTGININSQLPSTSLPAAQKYLDNLVLANPSLMASAPYSATAGGVGFGTAETKKTTPAYTPPTTGQNLFGQPLSGGSSGGSSYSADGGVFYDAATKASYPTTKKSGAGSVGLVGFSGSNAFYAPITANGQTAIMSTPIGGSVNGGRSSGSQVGILLRTPSGGTLFTGGK